ncbi:hypothetical protein [Virgibacillus sp. Bac332]|uniref:hypothetical protein n=1 Tax=Virgibacillus sp. Bac332 TaxID=2419842 RepID=UPI000EF4EF2D|nr:hypothetical protein [Virgibacillus sp. Bac332]
MDLETHYKNEVIGAVNTFIQMINQADKWNPEGKKIIENNWHYRLQDNNTFLAKLKINGADEVLSFQKSEWKNLSVNMLGNYKLKELYLRLSRQD